MNKKQKIRVIIQGAGLAYKGEVSEVVAGQIMAICLGEKESVASDYPSRREPAQTRGGRKDSPAEYMNRFGPKRNPDKILVLAGYVHAMENRDFNPGEIKRLFREAGENLPGNFGRDFKWVLKNAWIAKDPTKKGSFYITNTGLKVLEGGFPDELVKRTKGRANSQKRNEKPGKK